MKRILWKATGAAFAALAALGSASFGLAIADREQPIVYERVRSLSTSAPQGGLIEVEFSVFVCGYALW